MCRAYVKTKKKELKLVFAKPYLFGSWFWSLLEILSPQTRVPSVTGISGNNWMLPWYLPVVHPSTMLQCAFDLTFFSFKRDLQLLYVKFMALQKNCFCFQDCVECFLQIVVLVCSFAGRTCQMWNVKLMLCRVFANHRGKPNLVWYQGWAKHSNCGNCGSDFANGRWQMTNWQMTNDKWQMTNANDSVLLGFSALSRWGGWLLSGSAAQHWSRLDWRFSLQHFVIIEIAIR